MPTNREEFLKLMGLPKESHLSLVEIAILADMPTEALQEVYNRGIGAWKTNIASVRLKNFTKNADTRKYPRAARLTKEQWAMARVYAFVMGTKRVYDGADKDIAERYGV